MADAAELPPLARLTPSGLRVEACLPMLFVPLAQLAGSCARPPPDVLAAFLAAILQRAGDALREIHVGHGRTHGAVSPATVLVNHYGGCALLMPPGPGAAPAAGVD